MRRLFFFLIILIGATSCVRTPQLIYMQNDNLKENVPTNMPNPFLGYKLQPNDVLSVKVQSAQPELSNVFNIVDPANAFGLADPGSMFLSGYSVSENGAINLPILGNLKVSGLSTTETQELIQKQLVRYISDATVVVKLISYKISVLGSVRNPGYYYIYHERVTLLEGLAQAGDLTVGGNRRNVKLIRQTPGGTEVVLLDLTDPKIVQSPYYHLMPNDALYVEPLKSALNRDNLILVNAVFAAVSAAVLLLNYFQ
jgi:polysaccharide biosynthesis/export protein